MENMFDKTEKRDKGSTSRKLKKLKVQYNKILVDLFDKFAAESIEEALEEVNGAFGEKIDVIIQTAVDNLKGKVSDELGLQQGTEVASLVVGATPNGANDLLGLDFGANSGSSEGEDLEDPDHEDEETFEDEEKEDEEKEEE